MKKEHRELRRRPLLTPIWLFAFFGLAVLAAIFWFVSNMTTTTVVVVRHAEKDIGTIEDSPLSTSGEQRVQALARAFGERGGIGKLDAVFADETRRTQSTATPLATRLGLPVTVVADLDPLLSRIRSEYRGQNVLVVGQAETVPDIVRQLGHLKNAPAMAQTDYSTIYVLTIPTLGRASVLKLSY